MKIDIREFNEKDLNQARAVYLNARLKTFTWIHKEALTLESFDKDTRGEKIFVALHQKKVIGFISVWLPDNFIHHLFIDPGFQGLGIGTKLLSRGVEVLNSRITLKCIKENKPAVAFYSKNGWFAKSEGTSDDGVYILFEFKKH